MSKVFISHAELDKQLADALTDLLLVGVGLQQDQIFCTSLAGLGIPAGQDFKKTIGERLRGAPYVIALLTPNYYASAFCLCEAGATWILSKEFIPFTTPLAGFDQLKAVLIGTQALRLNEETALDEMRQSLEPLLAKRSSDARWTVKKKEFLDKLPAILAALPKPKLPTPKEHKDVIVERDGYKELNIELQAELLDCQHKYSAVAKLKDKGEVHTVELAHSDEQEQFDSLVNALYLTTKDLSKGVVEALYHSERGEDWLPNQDWDDRLTDDVEYNLLRSSEGLITVNEGHPKIRPAVEALNKLRIFVKNVSPEFDELYEAEHSDELRFASRGFWDRHIS
jgi:hypothetical protein